MIVLFRILLQQDSKRLCITLLTACPCILVSFPPVCLFSFSHSSKVSWLSSRGSYSLVVPGLKGCRYILIHPYRSPWLVVYVCLVFKGSFKAQEILLPTFLFHFRLFPSSKRYIPQPSSSLPPYHSLLAPPSPYLFWKIHFRSPVRAVRGVQSP